MNFTTLKTELSDRGFSYLSDTRLGQYVNWAYSEINDSDFWPYRRTTTSGAAPVTISDLGIIDTVVDTAHGNVVLRPATLQDLVRNYGDVSTTGTPIYYYIDGTQVKTYPVGGTLSIGYYKVPADLTGTDTPLVPTRFHRMIVDLAVSMAYRDNDNHESANALRAQVDHDLTLLRMTYLGSVPTPRQGVWITEAW